METYNYFEAVKNDVKNVVINDYDYIKELKEGRESFEQKLNDELFTKDNVTGNGSGSYTFSTWQAEENLCHNMVLLKDALADFGSDCSMLEDAEACDVTIRCYLLSSAIMDVLDELEEEIPED